MIHLLGGFELVRYIDGDCDRISPEAPVPIVRSVSDEIAIIGTVGIAAKISEFGEKAALFSLIGLDSQTNYVTNFINLKNGILNNMTEVSDVENRFNTIVTSKGHALLQISNFQSELQKFNVNDCFSPVVQSFEEGQVNIICDVGLDDLWGDGLLLNKAKAIGSKIIYDFRKPIQKLSYSHAAQSYLIAEIDDLKFFINHQPENDLYLRQYSSLVEKYNLSALILLKFGSLTGFVTKNNVITFETNFLPFSKRSTARDNLVAKFALIVQDNLNQSQVISELKKLT